MEISDLYPPREYFTDEMLDPDTGVIYRQYNPDSADLIFSIRYPLCNESKFKRQAEYARCSMADIPESIYKGKHFIATEDLYDHCREIQLNQVLGLDLFNSKILSDETVKEIKEKRLTEKLKQDMINELKQTKQEEQNERNKDEDKNGNEELFGNCHYALGNF